MRKPFARNCFARTFCTETLYHGFSARFLCTESFWCSKPLAGKRQNFTEKIHKKFTMLWGLSGEGLGREGEVDTLANLTKARVSEDWGGGKTYPKHLLRQKIVNNLASAIFCYTRVDQILTKYAGDSPQHPRCDAIS